MIVRILCSSCFAFLILSGYIPIEKQEKNNLIADTTHVIVMPVDYEQHNWEYWGFTNDWLQEEVVKKLNKDNQKKNIRFLTEEEARTNNTKADRIIELSFVNIRLGPPKERHYSSRRTRSIIAGYTSTTPQRPIYRTISATIYFEESYTENSAVLQYRIYNPSTNKNILLDHFTHKYYWSNVTATYNGYESVISSHDWIRINNFYRDVPPENEIAQQLIEDCSKILINKLKNKVKF